MEKKLIKEHRKQTEPQQTIEVQANLLKELYQTTAEAKSLSALAIAQHGKENALDLQMEQKKGDFEAEKALKKTQWKKEQEEHEAAKKERNAQVKKERTREAVRGEVKTPAI